MGRGRAVKEARREAKREGGREEGEERKGRLRPGSGIRGRKHPHTKGRPASPEEGTGACALAQLGDLD